jgi:hypothetical protein
MASLARKNAINITPRVLRLLRFTAAFSTLAKLLSHPVMQGGPRASGPIKYAGLRRRGGSSSKRFQIARLVLWPAVQRRLIPKLAVCEVHN